MKGNTVFQDIQGRKVYVVDFTVLPKLPVHAGSSPELTAYADALTKAIETGVITEPGKYGIEIWGPASQLYTIYTINE